MVETPHRPSMPMCIKSGPETQGQKESSSLRHMLPSHNMQRELRKKKKKVTTKMKYRKNKNEKRSKVDFKVK